MRLESHNYLDSLTGLKNRVKLHEDLHKNHYTLMAIINIDRVNFINNLYGSSIGDIVIKQFANYLKTQTKKAGFAIYKITGDEFSICGNSDNLEKFRAFIDKLSLSMSHLVLFIEEIGDEIVSSGTMGVTYEFHELSTFGMTFDAELLLTQANLALKNAQENKKSISIYNDSMNTLQHMQTILEIKQKIKDAIESDNIIAVFQPIVDKNGIVIKHETLMRLREVKDEKEKLLSPFFFLDISMLTRQYSKLSYITIEKALNHLICSDEILSINLAYTDMQDSKIINLLTTMLDKYPIANQLIFEILESEDIKDYSLVENFIQKYRDYGVKIAIDDFGSGYSNYENVINIKPDYIKIDDSLVKKIDKDRNSYIIVKSIVNFAKELGVKTIAEFVHSKEVFEIVKELGVDEFQGYYFYKPSTTLVSEALV